MKTAIKLVALGLITFIVLVIIKAPASLITKPLSANAPVQCERVSGSIWNGRIAQLTVNGIAIGSVKWKINGWRLFLGELQITISLGENMLAPNLSGTIPLTVSPSGTIEIEHAQLQTKAEWISTQAALPVMPTGMVDVNISQLKLNATTKQLPKIKAKASWTEAGISYPNPFSLGAYHVDLQHQPETEPKVIIGTITDSDSSLHVNGTVQIDNQWQYQTDITLQAEPDAPADIRGLLPYIGLQHDDGTVHIKRQGLLQNLQ